MGATATGIELPFLGLRYFDEEQADLFFGRDDQIRELLEKLGESRFVTVIGSSGSGKSSLVRAGLFPALRSGLLRGAPPRWRITKSAPGERPIHALAEALEKTFQSHGVELTLRRGPLGLIEAAAQCGLGADENLLVFIDQFEEIFRYERVATNRAAAREEAASFVRLLLEATASDAARIYVVLTMRSDYLGNASEFRDLPERINRGLYLIPRMTRDQIEEAIRGPIALANARISAPLAQRLLNDLGDSTDLLPVLQHAMLRTWLSWKAEGETGEALDLRHYGRAGGLKGGLNNHAEEIYESLSDEQKPVCEMLFRCLTERDAGERDIRRPTEVAAIARAAGVNAEAVREVAKPFRANGATFLLPPAEKELEDATKLDITHESLIRNWTRLIGTSERKGWVQEEAELRDQYRELVKRARRKRSEDDLLRGRDLDEAVQWRDRGCTAGWAERYDPDPAAFASVAAYVEASVVRRNHEIEAQQEAVRKEAKARESRRRQLVIEVAVVLVLVAVAVAASLVSRANQRALEAQETRARLEREARQQAEKVAGVERVLRGDAETLRNEALRQRATAEALMQVAVARVWFGEGEPAKMTNAVATLTGLVRDPNAVAEGRLRAAEELGHAPLPALPRDAFESVAATLRQSAQADTDPKVKAAARTAIATLNDQFAGEWMGAGPTVNVLTIRHEQGEIQISTRAKCGQADCESKATLPYPSTSVPESLEWKAGQMAFKLSRGRTATEVSLLSTKLKADGSPESNWTATTLVGGSGSIQVNLVDGARRPLGGVDVLFTVRDGNQTTIARNFQRSSSVLFRGLRVSNNFADNFTILVSAKGYDMAGYTPVRISAGSTQTVNLMLMRQGASYQFHSAQWSTLRQSRPALYRLLASGGGDEGARARYGDLIEREPAAMAALFNNTTAMSQMRLGAAGTVLDYVKQMNWNKPPTASQFFAFASAQLLEQLRAAAARGEFSLEAGAATFHPGVTAGYKQIQFGEANVAIYFYQNERRVVDGVECVQISVEMDYFRDLADHVLVEMARSGLDPKSAYRLRWMAAARGGVPEFNPPYTIE